MKETVILVGIHLQNNDAFEREFEEIRQLVDACEYTVLVELIQTLPKAQGSFRIGKGKVDELKALVQEHHPSSVVISEDLSPSQIRNIEKVIEIPVIDRSDLILSIFTKRARTRQAKLQVMIARLKLAMPRLVGSTTQFAQQVGGVGTTSRGPGEKKIELDRRTIRYKIQQMERELKEIKDKNETQRRLRKRNEVPLVALVGYTNAGKSTLMNAGLSRYGSNTKTVLEKNQMFSTLDTTVRRLVLEDNKVFLLSDTVGFVSHLPSDLLQAFRSTLQEIRDADLILHVIDVSNPEYRSQSEVTLNTLEELGFDLEHVISVYNKIDATEVQWENDAKHVAVSAKTGEGMTKLFEIIRTNIFPNYRLCTMKIPYGMETISSYFNEVASVYSQKEEEDGIIMKLECNNADDEKYKQYAINE